MRSKLYSAILGAALAASAAVTLAPTEALAAAFTPHMCSACPTMTEIPFQYAVGDWFGGKGELPVKGMYAGGPYMCSAATSDCGNYINNQRYTRHIFGNENIKHFGFATWAYDLEMGYDHLHYGHGFFDGGPVYVPGGSITGWSGSIWWRDLPLTRTLQNDSVQLVFETDGSIDSAGLAIDRARVCCQAPEATPNPGPLYDRYRTTGLLLATDDVVYFRFLAGRAQASESEDLHQTIALWADAAAGASDFDLYVRCNAKPTPTTFDARGFSSSHMEFLHLDPSLCPGGTWYVAVNAFNGAGQFNIVQHSHYASAHISLEVAFDDTVTDTQRASWEDYLTKSAKYYYAMTEGGRIIDEFHVHKNRTSCPFFDPLACDGSYCNLCINPTATGRAFAYTVWPKHIQLYANDLSSPSTLPHEFGHYDIGLPDEYKDESDALGDFSRPKCGHTVMGLGFTGKEYNLCYDGDHTKDRMHADPAGGDSGWKRVDNNSVPGHMYETPDNFPYVDFAFTNFPIGRIVEIN